MVSLLPPFRYPIEQSGSAEIKLAPNCFLNSIRIKVGVKMASLVTPLRTQVSKSFFFSRLNILTLELNVGFTGVFTGTRGLRLVTAVSIS